MHTRMPFWPSQKTKTYTLCFGNNWSHTAQLKLFGGVWFLQ